MSPAPRSLSNCTIGRRGKGCGWTSHHRGLCWWELEKQLLGSEHDADTLLNRVNWKNICQSSFRGWSNSIFFVQDARLRPPVGPQIRSAHIQIMYSVADSYSQSPSSQLGFIPIITVHLFPPKEAKLDHDNNFWSTHAFQRNRTYHLSCSLAGLGTPHAPSPPLTPSSNSPIARRSGNIPRSPPYAR